MRVFLPSEKGRRAREFPPFWRRATSRIPWPLRVNMEPLPPSCALPACRIPACRAPRVSCSPPSCSRRRVPSSRLFFPLARADGPSKKIKRFGKRAAGEGGKGLFKGFFSGSRGSFFSLSVNKRAFKEGGLDSFCLRGIIAPQMAAAVCGRNVRFPGGIGSRRARGACCVMCRTRREERIALSLCYIIPWSYGLFPFAIRKWRE